MKAVTAIASTAAAVLLLGGFSAGAVALQKAFEVQEAPAEVIDVAGVAAQPPATQQAVPSPEPEEPAPAEPAPLVQPVVADPVPVDGTPPVTDAVPADPPPQAALGEPAVEAKQRVLDRWSQKLRWWQERWAKAREQDWSGRVDQTPKPAPGPTPTQQPAQAPAPEPVPVPAAPTGGTDGRWHHGDRDGARTDGWGTSWNHDGRRDGRDKRGR